MVEFSTLLFCDFDKKLTVPTERAKQPVKRQVGKTKLQRIKMKSGMAALLLVLKVQTVM
jgi:hypothetical protein